MPDPQADPGPSHDPDVLFQENGPIHPGFMDEAIRTLMRSLPLADPDEPEAWSYRRMRGATQALAALHPRDEIEVMLGVQAVAAYHAAAASWRLGMNLRRPHGDSTRHISTAATAARAFDTMLRAVERRQVKPLSVPPGRPSPRQWPPSDPATFIRALEDRCRREIPSSEPLQPISWSPEAIAAANEFIERERIEQENHGLDIANTEGILPDGSIIVPEEPTSQQEAYIARRLVLMYRREILENRRNGITTLPKIRPLRTGDRVP